SHGQLQAGKRDPCPDLRGTPGMGAGHEEISDFQKISGERTGHPRPAQMGSGSVPGRAFAGAGGGEEQKAERTAAEYSRHFLFRTGERANAAADHPGAGSGAFEGRKEAESSMGL